MITHEPMAGARIDREITRIIAMAKETGEDVTMMFNGVPLVAQPTSDAAELSDAYNATMQKKHEDYINSPKGKRDTEKARLRKVKAQATIDAALNALPALDFTDVGALLNWLSYIQDATDCMGIDKHGDEIVAVFHKHGYLSNVNIGKDFNGEDADNFACYLIGQALDGLRSVGAIHHVFQTMFEQWKTKFAA